MSRKLYFLIIFSCFFLIYQLKYGNFNCKGFYMFESIYGQDKVINLIQSDIHHKTLNNSMIFHGPQSTGKLTTALEVMRVLNCREDGEAGCSCTHCSRITDFDFEGFIFLSRRDFSRLIKQLINCYESTGEEYYLHEILKVIKLLSLPLQDFLIKHTFSEADKKQLGNHLKKIYDIIYADKITKTGLDNLLKTVVAINSFYKKLNIPVNTLREMLDWTYISRPDIKRVVIIDHFDYFESSSQNILLKRLEEPSPNLFFILIAEKKNKILQTILSRCRCYYFNNMTQDDTLKILQTKFGVNDEFQSVNDFFYKDDELSKDKIIPILSELLNLTFLKDASFSDLSAFISAYNDRKIVRAILFYFKELLEKEILRRQTDILDESELKILKNISNINILMLNSLVTGKYSKIDLFNLNPLWILEGIFYPLKVMVHNDKI